MRGGHPPVNASASLLCSDAVAVGAAPALCSKLTGMDVKGYMAGLGRRARAASRVLARADTAIKNRALAAIAAEIVK